MDAAEYIGTELELFKEALVWKRYWSGTVAPYIRGRCCEVGAGLGANLPFLNRPGVTSWLLVEPDVELFKSIEELDTFSNTPVTALNGCLSSTRDDEFFDTIAYIDVLEHIEKDQAELSAAKSRLRQGGHICVVVPAHEWLRSPFDDSIGHVRRYNRARFLELAKTTGMDLILMRELDSIGLFASLVNRLFLKQKHPTLKQIKFWDRFLVPLSRIFDPLLGYKVGKSIVAVFAIPPLRSLAT